jgi:hypothetical protein
MLTTRAIEGDGFGPKVLDLDRKEALLAWRESWAEAVNGALERAGHAARVDHRSLVEQGIAREPTVHEGWVARRMGAKADRVRLNIEIRERNRQLELAAAAWAPEIGAQSPAAPERVEEAPRAHGGEGRRPSPGLEKLLERARAVGASGTKPQMQAPQARPGPIPGAQGPEGPPRAGKGRKWPPAVAVRLRAALDGVRGLGDLITSWPEQRAAGRQAEGVRFAEEGRVDAGTRVLQADQTLIRAPIDRIRDPDQGIERFMEAQDTRERQREQEIDQKRAEAARRSEEQASWELQKEIWARIDAWLEAVRADPTLFRDRIDPERDHGQPLHRFQEVIDTARVKLPLPTPDMMPGLWKQLQYLQDEWDRKAEAEVLFRKAARRHARHLHLRGGDTHTHNTRTAARSHRAPTGRSGPSGRNR